MEKFMDWLWAVVVEYGPKLLVALIVFLVGLWLAKLVTKLVMKMLQRGKVDVTLDVYKRQDMDGYCCMRSCFVTSLCPHYTQGGKGKARLTSTRLPLFRLLVGKANFISER